MIVSQKNLLLKMVKNGCILGVIKGKGGLFVIQYAMTYWYGA